MNKRAYTDDELIRRVWDVEEIKKLASKRVYYQANEWRDRELDELHRMVDGIPPEILQAAKQVVAHKPQER